MKIGIAADHGGFELKEKLREYLRQGGFEVVDFGAKQMDKDDDYPDYVIPLARAVARGSVERGVAVCGSGVGASVAANKIEGVRAAVITDVFSAHQGVEDDDMNIICLGGRVVAEELAKDLVKAFLSANYVPNVRHKRRLDKVRELEKHNESEI
jgi:ribose 5-phosphate isomerase B